MTQTNEDDGRRLIRRAGRLIRRSRRWWPLHLLALLVMAAAAVAVPYLLPPVYTSSAVLVYRELIPSTTLFGEDAPIETARQRGARLREMLLARSNLEAIINEFGLYPEIVHKRGKAEAVDEFLKDADCRVGEDTFAIKFEYSDPDLVQKVTARLAQSLLEQSTQYRHDQAKSTTKFLEAQRAKTKRELAEKEQALARFLAEHPEFAQDMMMAGGTSPAGASIRAQERKAQAVDPTIDALQRQRARLASRLDTIDNPSSGVTKMTPPADLDPQIATMLENAQRDYERAQEEASSARSRYTEVHPDVRHAEARLARATVALRAAQKAALTSRAPARASAPPPKESDRSTLKDQLRGVENNLAAAARKKADAAPGKNEDVSNWIVELETEWASLNREVHDERERYQQIERSFFQATIIDHVEESGGAAQMTVVDPAYRPERPARRGSKRVGAAAAGAALAFFVALIL
ncbi:MAG TPA: hypothetical protein VFB62_24820, partial [Polyangiaceae bacterium]|nr:hypothetical protein [Polyangiaceae bacterium]